MAYKFFLGFKSGHFAFSTLNFVVTESLSSKPTHVLPRYVPGSIVLMENNLFLNIRTEISVLKH